MALILFDATTVAPFDENDSQEYPWAINETQPKSATVVATSNPQGPSPWQKLLEQANLEINLSGQVVESSPKAPESPLWVDEIAPVPTQAPAVEIATAGQPRRKFDIENGFPERVETRGRKPGQTGLKKPTSRKHAPTPEHQAAMEQAECRAEQYRVEWRKALAMRAALDDYIKEVHANYKAAKQCATNPAYLAQEILKGSSEIQEGILDCLNELKMFYGIYPYNNDSNHCKGDAVFAKSIDSKYGELIVSRARKVLGVQA